MAFLPTCPCSATSLTPSSFLGLMWATWTVSRSGAAGAAWGQHGRHTRHTATSGTLHLTCARLSPLTALFPLCPHCQYRHLQQIDVVSSATNLSYHFPFGDWCVVLLVCGWLAWEGQSHIKHMHSATPQGHAWETWACMAYVPIALCCTCTACVGERVFKTLITLKLYEERVCFGNTCTQ